MPDNFSSRGVHKAEVSAHLTSLLLALSGVLQRKHHSGARGLLDRIGLCCISGVHGMTVCLGSVSLPQCFGGLGDIFPIRQ